MYLTYVSFYSTIFTFLYSSYMKETEWINCFPQNLTKSLFCSNHLYMIYCLQKDGISVSTDFVAVDTAYLQVYKYNKIIN